jgi:hypothetical protein
MPPMTVTIAMTIATIGRLMKSFEIINQSLLRATHFGLSLPEIKSHPAQQRG